MGKLDPFYQKVAPHALSLLRVVVAGMFLLHGSQKLFGIPSSMHAGGGPLPPLILVAGILEFFGGLLVLLGLGVRPVSFILSGQMAVAYFMAHASHGFLPVVNGGEAAVFYCFTFFYFAVAGGGVWSLDHLFRRNRPAIAPHAGERSMR
jgi:putative oxidoreductase